MVAWFTVRTRFRTVDCLGKDPGTCSLANAAGAAEQVCLRQVIVLYCILQGSRDGILSYNHVEGGRSVLSGRNNKIIHILYQRILRLYHPQI